MHYIGKLEIKLKILCLCIMIIQVACIMYVYPEQQYKQQQHQKAMLILYIIQLALLLIATIIIVCYFSHESTPYYVRALTVLSFNLSFICFLILPIDIYETSISEQKNETISLIWTIVYDANFLLCWFVLPLVQEYEDSGQLTRIGKFKEALRNNAIMILLIIGFAIVLVIGLVVAGKFTISQLPSVFATIVNIFGLFILSSMLGFGLVSFPKENFMKIDYRRRVNRCHRMAQALKSQQQQTKQQIYQISKILEQRNRSSQSDGHETQTIYLIQQKINFANFRSYAEPQTIQKLREKKNTVLYTIVKKRLIQYNACESQLDELVDELRQVSVEFSKNSYGRLKGLYIGLFVVSTLLSLLIYLAETSTFIPIFQYVNILSLINWASPASYFLNCVLIFYIVYIVTHTVFRIKVYRTFSLHKKHSSSSSLMFTSINLARICYPLCYNYLQLTHIKSAAFLSFFGEMNFNSRISFIFPIVMIVFGVFNLLDIYDGILRFFGLGSFAFDQDDQRQLAEEGRKVLIDRLKERNIQNSKMEMIQLL